MSTIEELKKVLDERNEATLQYRKEQEKQNKANADKIANLEESVKLSNEKRDELEAKLAKEKDKKNLSTLEQEVSFEKNIRLNEKIFNAYNKKEQLSLNLNEFEDEVHKELGLNEDEIKRLSYNDRDNKKGGNVTMPFFDREVSRLRRQQTNIYDVVSVKSITGSRYEKPQVNFVESVVWGTKFPTTESPTIDFDKKHIETKALSFRNTVEELLLKNKDFDIVGEILMNASKSEGRAIAQAVVSGNNSLQPRGFNPDGLDNASADSDLTKFRLFSRTASQLTSNFDEYKDLKTQLKDVYYPNACWYMNKDTRNELSKIKDNENRYYWQNSNIAGEPDMFLGYPVKLIHELPNRTGTGSGTFILFGDLMEAYHLVETIGMNMQIDPYNDFPNLIYKTIRYVGGGLVNGEALKGLRQS